MIWTALTILLVYINTLYYLRGFEQTSWLVQTLAAISIDSLPFLLILVILITGFGVKISTPACFKSFN